MAKEVGQKAVQKQFEIMEEQQKKAQEFIDQKVTSQLLKSFWLIYRFAYNSTHLSQLLIQINTEKASH